MEQDAHSRPRRSAKRKDKAAGSRKKSVVTPASFKLHTEELAEKRKQQREEKEVVQLRHVQHKILGRKTVEDFAQLKLIRRESTATRSRTLHCNGKTLNVPRRSKECELLEANDQVPEKAVRLESRPLMSARLSSPVLVSDSVPQRPQSAKPVLQSQHRQHGSVGIDEDADILDNTKSKKLYSSSTKKKRKKKSSDRKSGRLTPSASAPVLPDRTELSPSAPPCKKISIIVNMRNLQLAEKQESPIGSSPPVMSREAWGAYQVDSTVERTDLKLAETSKGETNYSVTKSGPDTLEKRGRGG